MLPRKTSALLFAALAAGPLAITACNNTPNRQVAADTGEVSLALNLAGGAVINSATYTITGPQMFSRTGTIDLGNSSVLTANIGGLPGGSGYSITANATSTDTKTTCLGSATFTVTPRSTTAVALRLICREPTRTGGIAINGTINVCPVVDGLSATPAEVLIDGSIALAAAAHDSDAAPSALTFSWQATSGVFDNANIQNPRFTCTSPGPVTLSLKVSDGDTDPTCADSTSVQVTCTAAVNRIVFFLGDGLGIPVVTAARIFAVGEEGELAMDKLPETAFVRTASNNAQVADSAPTMSAYMTGVKMNNDVIAMSTDTVYQGATGTPVTTLLELAEAARWSTGIVTTTRVTHATPAATYAHISDRDRENDIAAQVVPGSATYNPALADGLEVIFGGGRRHFEPALRADGLDLVSKLTTAGYTYTTTRGGFDALTASTTKAVALFTSSHLSYDLDRNPSVEPSLKEMSLKAVDILAKNNKGFFLMIEGGRIDHALHETNAKRALVDAVAFDDALAATIARLRVDDPDLSRTLIVVTADHDHTMVLNGYSKRTGATTASNAGVLGVLRDYTTGNVAKDADGMPFTVLTFGNGENRPAGKRSAFAPLDDSMTSANGYRQEAAIRTTPGNETHGGTDVSLHAIGRGAESFHGFMNNTEVFPVLRAAAGL